MKREKQPPTLTVELERQEWYMTLGGQPVLRCVTTTPVPTGTWRGLAAIGRFYRRRERAVRRRWQRDIFLRACLDLADRRADGRAFRPWQAELETRVTCIRDGMMSVRQELRERRGPNGIAAAVLWGDTWSLQDGAPRTLASLCSGRGWKKDILEQLARRAQERLDSGESLLDADCLRRLRRGFDPERFCLTEEGAEIFYPMGVIADAAEGTPTFPVSLPVSVGAQQKRQGKSAASPA